MLKPTLKLTVLMETSVVQRVRSTVSHKPDGLQVLLIRVVVLGQRRVRVVPAGVAGQDRNPVLSALHPPAAAHECVNKVRVMKTQKSYS